MSKPTVEDLFLFMEKRHQIYLDREAGKSYPWTDDPILGKFRFCNIYRELDTVTKWIREKWREPYEDHQYLWFAMAVARYINFPETLAAIGFPHYGWERRDRDRAQEIMEGRLKQGKQVFTGAYMILGGNGELGKIEDIVQNTLGNVWRDRAIWLEDPPQTIQAATVWFTKHRGFGGFMAYEAVTDLRHTSWLRNAPDIMTWANAGPGAIRGLNRLYGFPLKKGMSQAKALILMQDILLQATKRKTWIPDIQQRGLEMRDIEHSLCEFDKYQRVLLGEGTPRSLYKPQL